MRFFKKQPFKNHQLNLNNSVTYYSFHVSINVYKIFVYKNVYHRTVHKVLWVIFFKVVKLSLNHSDFQLCWTFNHTVLSSNATVNHSKNSCSKNSELKQYQGYRAVFSHEQNHSVYPY